MDKIVELNKAELYKIIAKNLKTFRRKARLTQIELAALANIGVGSIRNYEQNRGNGYNISAINLYLICRASNIPVESFFQQDGITSRLVFGGKDRIKWK